MLRDTHKAACCSFKARWKIPNELACSRRSDCEDSAKRCEQKKKQKKKQRASGGGSSLHLPLFFPIFPALFVLHSTVRTPGTSLDLSHPEIATMHRLVPLHALITAIFRKSFSDSALSGDVQFFCYKTLMQNLQTKFRHS